MEVDKMEIEEKKQLGYEVEEFLAKKNVTISDMRKVLSNLYYRLSDDLKAVNKETEKRVLVKSKKKKPVKPKNSPEEVVKDIIVNGGDNDQLTEALEKIVKGKDSDVKKESDAEIDNWKDI
jgi:hypothetical protein